ncbi:MAG: hypothetical protein DMG49_06575 [Acidobacteria bacterium]|nr:MAG: hypothetical protein DMG49_06575 [Acidobacteriota bacterium]
MGSFSMGAPLTVNLASQATFSIDTSGFMLPSGLNFASTADLMVGQELRLHPTGAPTGTPPNLMVTVDQVQLEPSFLTGNVTAVNTSSNPQTFTLGSLPSFFTNGSKRKKTKPFPGSVHSSPGTWFPFAGHSSRP